MRAILVVFLMTAPPVAGSAGATEDDGLPRMTAFRKLVDVYEPSAVQQLPDGRFIVLEDEKDHPLALLTLKAGGGFRGEEARSAEALLRDRPQQDDAGPR